MLKEVDGLADQNNPNTHEKPAFAIEPGHGLSVNLHLFQWFCDSGLNKRSAKDLAFNTFEHYLCRFIEKIDGEGLNNSQ